MADKFYVAHKISPDDTSAARKTGWLLFESGPHSEFSLARLAAHDASVRFPGRTFTIIKIVGHAVADLVRDIEP